MKKFNVSKIIKPNKLKIKNYTLIDRRLGVNKITINKTFGTIKINVSSKILKDNYAKGININTLEQLQYEINNSGIELHKDFINDCQVIKADVKNDLKLNSSVDDYINSLNQLIAPKFTKTKYDTGIVFNEKIKAQPIRLTGYSKEYELKQNKKFYRELPHLLNFFDNVLRLESRLPTKATVSKYFKSNNLIEILNASNINYHILDKVIDKQTNFKPYINTKKMTNSEEKNFAQIFYLNDYYNGDFENIMKHIKSKLGKNTKATYQRNIVRKYLSMINNADSDYNIERIKEVRQALKSN
ncbi:MAG: phage/plasmid replication protein [Algibacter sp.]|uniref:phage/plasmid replication domain-containing protein n=1 Tax=Algibacter sp. TaxID=1872428 RepID=UPI0032980050